MGHVVAPQIQLVRDAFVVQDTGKVPRGVWIFVAALAGGDQNAFVVAHLLELLLIVDIGQIIRR